MSNMILKISSVHDVFKNISVLEKKVKGYRESDQKKKIKRSGWVGPRARLFEFGRVSGWEFSLIANSGIYLYNDK